MSGPNGEPHVPAGSVGRGEEGDDDGFGETGGSGGWRPVWRGGTSKGCTTLECTRPPSSSSVPDSHPPSPSSSVSLLPSGSWPPQTAIGQFGVGKSTVRAILMQVMRAINSLLLRRVIRLQDLDATMGGFAVLGFPNCAELSVARISPSGPWNIKQFSL
ncbi:bublin coiled-coil protein isoform X2 [Pelodiscus sinensis]|uniref:bublin coiled-coil protein isoform X2 n=1 Tax=Pelodiscus sinensis TaxID=13735 RepID=UPI003F6C19B0